MQPIPHKFCPRCGQPCVLSFRTCQRCGWKFSSFSMKAFVLPALIAILSALSIVVFFRGSSLKPAIPSDQKQETDSPSANNEIQLKIVWSSHSQGLYVGYITNISPSELRGLTMQMTYQESERQNGFTLPPVQKVVTATWQKQESITKLSGHTMMGDALGGTTPFPEYSHYNLQPSESVTVYLRGESLSFPPDVEIRDEIGARISAEQELRKWD